MLFRSMLLERGVDVNTQGGFYGNAPQAAAARGSLRIAKILLEKGADINARGGKYGSAIQAAIEEEEESVIKLLRENGAQTFEIENDKNNA